MERSGADEIHTKNILFFLYRYPSEQTSEKMALHQGRLYYMEADMLEDEGTDHLEVGVVLPDGKKLTPIPKKLLRTGKFKVLSFY